MATIATPAVLTMKDCVVTIGADSFEKHLSAAAFNPTTATIEWQGLSPDASFTDVSTAKWNVSLTFAQDWDDEQSLCNYLMESEGERVVMVFAPAKGGTTFTANVTLSPGTIGGSVNSAAEATVTLGCDKPVRAFAP